MSKYLMNNCTGEERTEDDRTVRKVLYTYDRVGRLVRKEVVRNLTDMSGGSRNAMCREKPQQILHYHGKKAKEMYSRLKEVYDDPGIPPEADCLIRVRRQESFLHRTG